MRLQQGPHPAGVATRRMLRLVRDKIAAFHNWLREHVMVYPIAVTNLIKDAVRLLSQGTPVAVRTSPSLRRTPRSVESIQSFEDNDKPSRATEVRNRGGMSILHRVLGGRHDMSHRRSSTHQRTEEHNASRPARLFLSRCSRSWPSASLPKR